MGHSDRHDGRGSSERTGSGYARHLHQGHPGGPTRHQKHLRMSRLQDQAEGTHLRVEVQPQDQGKGLTLDPRWSGSAATDMRLMYSILRTLNDVFGTLYTALCILYSVFCILHSVFCILYSVFCILYSLFSILSSVFCIPYSVFCILHSVFSVLYSVFCTLYSVLCTLYSTLYFEVFRVVPFVLSFDLFKLKKYFRKFQKIVV